LWLSIPGIEYDCGWGLVALFVRYLVGENVFPL
jgi:hypothetical protein